MNLDPVLQGNFPGGSLAYYSSAVAVDGDWMIYRAVSDGNIRYNKDFIEEQNFNFFPPAWSDSQDQSAVISFHDDDEYYIGVSGTRSLIRVRWEDETPGVSVIENLSLPNSDFSGRRLWKVGQDSNYAYYLLGRHVIVYNKSLDSTSAISSNFPQFERGIGPLGDTGKIYMVGGGLVYFGSLSPTSVTWDGVSVDWSFNTSSAFSLFHHKGNIYYALYSNFSGQYEARKVEIIGDNITSLSPAISISTSTLFSGESINRNYEVLSEKSVLFLNTYRYDTAFIITEDPVGTFTVDFININISERLPNHYLDTTTSTLTTLQNYYYWYKYDLSSYMQQQLLISDLYDTTLTISSSITEEIKNRLNISDLYNNNLYIQDNILDEFSDFKIVDTLDLNSHIDLSKDLKSNIVSSIDFDSKIKKEI